eukprot:TRINITY_DN2119_c0_g1_i2.p1 TRINITY_DN2119_c0_g1~~TRINITY_DN2119_c0_g1_i2.p1  ORF type:complete len:287 (-),score=57.86 TRINITY_DN2119_c0_g1_i2:93-953(-)
MQDSTRTGLADVHDSKGFTVSHDNMVPGYGGHIAGSREHFGTTYGRMTAELQRDETVPKSTHTFRDLEKAQPSPARSRSHSVGAGDSFARITSCRDGNDLVPGYTGFVPRKHELYGQNYTQECHEAMHIVRESRGSRRKQTPLASLNMKSSQPRRTNSGQKIETPPSTAGRIPGYTGFVPLIYDHELGNRFGESTAKSLQTFGDTGKRQTFFTSPKAPRPDTSPLKSVAPPLPGYTGHVCGMKECLGETYSQSSAKSFRKLYDEQRGTGKAAKKPRQRPAPLGATL